MPIKLFVLVKRAPGMSLEEFRHGYETIHSRFGLKHWGHLWIAYRRSYINWDHLSTGKAYRPGDAPPCDDNLPFDAISEVVFRDFAAVAAGARIRRETEVGEMIPADEEASGFFRQGCFWLASNDTVEEDLPTRVATAGDGGRSSRSDTEVRKPIRLFVLVKRAPGFSLDEFRHGYETGHSRFGLKHFGHLWTGYRRNYINWNHLTTGKAYRLGDAPPCDDNLPFDAISEVVYPDFETYAEAARIRRETEVGGKIPADEEASGFYRQGCLWLASNDTVEEDMSTAVAAAGNAHV